VNNIPLSDASLSEVLARVSYRLIERRLAWYDEPFELPIEALSILYGQLERRGWSVMSTWVSAYAFYLAQGELPEFTRQRFIFRARLGFDFRSVLYADYKAMRRGDPRVTKRGVTARATKRGRDAAS